jgi:hypothetical protein
VVPVVPFCSLMKIACCRGAACRETPVFMRSRRNVPPFTISLSGCIVNGFYRVSTGFLWFSLVFIGMGTKKWPFWGIFGGAMEDCALD